ncbi:hypothetical protein GKIL_1773 [Gloeobacter kilaueensis JS1]|uniref:Uncharacterized protein n=1 Tax=Gloeobacter kilaueensis (strain ATCC BAA-2537 / CCAP 1431/1 / ULC 316 / JS1) TaxID=1183438 RepID=U5QK70_GLOK1|nr:hypothetical protein GKIL_1773 [Gloeobacter kilaueensis JS1]
MMQTSPIDHFSFPTVRNSLNSPLILKVKIYSLKTIEIRLAQALHL